MLRLLNSYSIVGYVDTENCVTLCPMHAPIAWQNNEDDAVTPIFANTEYWEDWTCEECLHIAVMTKTMCETLGQIAGLRHWYREDGSEYRETA